MKALRLLALLGLAAGLGVPAATAAHECAGPSAAGDWPTYGRDLNNSRNQELETTIGPDNVLSLQRSWAASTTQLGATGGYSNTPIVVGGCAYLATNSGRVIAVNADTGARVWTSGALPGAGQTLLGGVIVGSPAVDNGSVFVGVSRPGTPYVAAIDIETGALRWTATVEGFLPPPEQENSSALINSGALFYRNAAGEPRIFMGFSGNEGQAKARGGFAIVDASPNCDTSVMHLPMDSCNPAYAVPGASGGRIVKHTYTIDNREFAQGYRGASIWCTAAIDTEDLYAYACGGNPASKKIEHRYSNALLKADIDERRPTFGKIVDAYKGEVDQYYPGLDRQPVCDAFGDTLVVVWSLACLQLDLDFGSSPNLYRDDNGNLLLGDLQKSGVYHAVYADNMQRAWTSVVGTPCLACNAASPAYDAARGQIYTATTTPSAIWSITSNAGRYRWVGPIGEPTHFQPVSTANGVVYTMDAAGALNAFDADSGRLLLRRPISLDVGTTVTDAGSAGIAIARNTIYVTTADWIVAYRLPA